MQVQFWAATDVGKKRGHNEDNFLVDRDLRLFVVCDGMGGHSAGEVASAVAVQTIRNEVREGADELGFAAVNETPPSDEAICELLELAVRRASDRIRRLGAEDESRKGMGTTCSLLMFLDDRGFVAHVGDSRIYRVQKGEVERVTEDHSLRNEMLRQGKISPDESLDQENAVVRAVGVSEDIEVDSWVLTPELGDRFVLCSDGLTDYIEEDDQVADLIDEADLEEATDACIEFANQSGGQDNITVIVAEMAEGEGVRDARALRPRQRALADVPMFEYLGSDELESVAGHTRMKTADHGGLLFGPGRPIDGLYIVLEGEVEVGEAGQVAATLGPGDYFGVRALIGHEPLGFTAETASESVRLLSIDREAFHEILGEHQQLATKILWNCVDWLGERTAYLSVDQLRNPEQLVDASVETHEIDVSSIERPTTDSTTGSRQRDAFGAEPSDTDTSPDDEQEEEPPRASEIAVDGDTPPPSDMVVDDETPAPSDGAVDDETSPPSNVVVDDETPPPTGDARDSGASSAVGSSDESGSRSAVGSSSTSGSRSSLGDRPDSEESPGSSSSRESGVGSSPGRRSGNGEKAGGRESDGERRPGRGDSGIESAPSVSEVAESVSDEDESDGDILIGQTTVPGDEETEEDQDALDELEELAGDEESDSDAEDDETVKLNIDDEDVSGE